MHQSHILQCTALYQECAHVCAFLLQNGALWDTWCIVGSVRWVYSKGFLFATEKCKLYYIVAYRLVSKWPLSKWSMWNVFTTVMHRALKMFFFTLKCCILSCIVSPLWRNETKTKQKQQQRQKQLEQKQNKNNKHKNMVYMHYIHWCNISVRLSMWQGLDRINDKVVGLVGTIFGTLFCGVLADT